MLNNMINEIKGLTVYEFDKDCSIKFDGLFSDSVKFIERNQMCEVGLWKKFVDQFRIKIDGDNSGWRCEYWGKMMRGACMILSYTRDDGIYRIVEASIRDMLTTQEDNGRFSTYAVEKEFTAWDIWGRKYVILGFLYFLEICRDNELSTSIVASLRRHADYIVERVGNGKIDITKATNHWKGLNSCSILEPMVRLYKLTGDKKYLDFSEYIISTGFIDGGDIIELAYNNEISPYEYPVVKAYEMMSCFEGLLQYYKITGIEKYKTACLNIGYRILQDELSIIGCCGCTHELFDNTALKQTQTDYKGIVQETCVTVTFMRFAAALLELSGDSAFADAIEQSFYNAYLGSLNTERVLFSRFPIVKDVPQVMPFDSYSPLTAGCRGRETGGYNVFPDGTFYGCCACIGAAGAGIIPNFSLMRKEKGIILNFYESGTINTKTPSGKILSISQSTDYPRNGLIRITLKLKKAENFGITLRVPAWCQNATLTISDKSAPVPAGYVTIEKEWQDGECLELNLPMAVKRILPPLGADNEDVFAAYKRGPVVLAADSRLVDPNSVIDIVCDEWGQADHSLLKQCSINKVTECVKLKKQDGTYVQLIDYASAGKTWSKDSECAAWLRLKEIEN